jgi:hypothetical protein
MDLPSHEIVKLYHYTNIDVIDNIIDIDKNVCRLWSTDILYLNDSKEFRYTFDLIEDEYNKCKKQLKKPRTLSELGLNDHIFSAQNDIENIISLFKSQSSNNVNIHISSFSEKEDNLSQWRGYCYSGKGIALGFDHKKLSDWISGDNGIELKQCVYEKSKQVSVIKPKVIALINDLEESYQNQNDEDGDSDYIAFQHTIYFLKLASIYKHHSFIDEGEWRIIQNPEKKKEILFRPGKSMIIPYTEVEIPIKYLSTVFIGPCPHKELAENSVKRFLKKKGIDCNVESSKVPFRDW